METQVEGKDLDTELLRQKQPPPASLAVYTLRKAELKRLWGLDLLPLKALELRWLSSPDLIDIPLPPSLETLKIWHSNKFKSLEGLEQAPKLQELILDDNGALENMTALGAMTHLKSLSITGGFSSLQKVTRLDALDGLPLEKLTLRAIDGAKLDLSPLANLSNLQELDLHGPNFEPEELAKVAAAHPWFLDQLLDLEDARINGMGCKKCKAIQKQMFLKRKKFLWCPNCNQAGIDKVLDEFRVLVRKAG